MALVRHHVPLDGAAHVEMLGGEPEDLAAGHADDEDPGVEFWAEPGDRPRLLRVFTRDDFLPVSGAVLIGEARAGHGLRLHLYEMPRLPVPLVTQMPGLRRLTSGSRPRDSLPDERTR